MTERCDRCGQRITDEAERMGWPIAAIGGTEYVCPDCYGAEAYCSQGHCLPADSDTSECPTCSGEKAAR